LGHDPPEADALLDVYTNGTHTMLTKSDTARYAKKLALNLSDEELDAMTEYLNDMEEFVSILDEVDTEGVEPMFSPLESEDLRLREDEAKEFPNMETIMKNAPDVKDGHIAVPNIRKKNAKD
jgi:aspartyl-tRNA(Asn)/glutamyl-tRNA(Gln) amidotransferase subunit C